MNPDPPTDWRRHVQRTQVAEQQIREAHEPPTAMEKAMEEFDESLRAQEDESRQADRVTLRCAHAMWTDGCSSCADWAVKNGVEFARQMATRDAQRKAEDEAGVSVLLIGNQAAAWRTLQDAVQRSQAASTETNHANAGLRTAIEAVCKVMGS